MDDIFVHARLLHKTKRASVNSAEEEASAWLEPSISADGRFVAFASSASNLDPADADNYSDIFVHDMATGETRCVSVDPPGGQRIDGSSAHISPDGRYVTFVGNQVYLHDRITGGTELISVVPNGAILGGHTSSGAAVSADGRYVTFGWFGFDLSTGQSLADGHVFLRDRQAQTTTLIDRNSVDARGNDNSWQPTISADGRTVVFSSWATNLVAEDSGANANIHIRDIPTGMITRASSFLPSIAINGDAQEPSISANGRYVAFTAAATNLVANDTNQSTDVFVYDRDLGVTERVSISSNGAQGLSDSIDPVISADGRFIAYSSAAANMTSGDTNGRADVFLRDRLQGTTIRVSTNVMGAETAADADDVAMSADGRFIAFSTRRNLFGGTAFGSRQVYLFDRITSELRRISLSPTGSTLSDSRDPAVSADGRFTTFAAGFTEVFRYDLASGVTESVAIGSDSSISDDGMRVAFFSREKLVPDDPNSDFDPYVRDMATGQTIRIAAVPGGDYDYGLANPVISGDGRFVTFESSDEALATGTALSIKIFVYEIATGRLTCASVTQEGMPTEGLDGAISADGRLIAFRSTDGAVSSQVTNSMSNIYVAQNPLLVSSVIDRHIFYNNSRFDDPQFAGTDDLAIAPDKQALLPGGTATFGNYTSYYRGINGLMIDIENLAGDLTADDFTFRIGNDNNPSAWQTLATAPSISVRSGAGVNGSDRVTLVWPDFSVMKTWLQVTVKVTENTGLLQPDVFYFGNAVGESGTSPLDARVTSLDEIVARNNPRSIANPVDISSPYDYNRDTRVSSVDQIIARNNRTVFGTALELIQVPPTVVASGLSAQGLSEQELVGQRPIAVEEKTSADLRSLGAKSEEIEKRLGSAEINWRPSPPMSRPFRSDYVDIALAADHLPRHSARAALDNDLLELLSRPARR